MWFLRFARSRTTTVPCTTFVVVPEQLSLTRYLVPRTVAVEWRPRVRKRPFTFANGRGEGRLRAAVTPAEPARAFGFLQSRLKFPPPSMFAVVSGEAFDCLVMNTPRLNCPFCVVVPFLFEAIVMLEIPRVASRIEPTGMLSSLPSVRNGVSPDGGVIAAAARATGRRASTRPAGAFFGTDTSTVPDTDDALKSTPRVGAPATVTVKLSGVVLPAPSMAVTVAW